MNKDKIEKILDKYSSKKYIKGLGFNIYDSKTNESILLTRGNIKKDSQFFIASTIVKGRRIGLYGRND